MAAWLPILKTALPYVSSIVSAALPVFTSRKEQDASAELVSRQISELQEAARGNAETLKGLAAQVEKTITALDAGEADLAQRLAGLQEALARSESTTALAQAQITRLEAELAALRERQDQAGSQSATHARRERVIAAMALLALIVSLLAWLT